MNPPRDLKSQQATLIGMVALISLSFVFLGLWCVVDGHFTGHSRQSATVTLEGASARLMGAFIACMGMVPLALTMPTKRWSLRWCVLWFLLAGLCLVFLLRRVYAPAHLG